MFDVQTPRFVNYMNGVTDYATGLNAGSEVWDNRNIDTTPLQLNSGYYIEIKYLSSDGYYGSRVIPKDSFKNYEPTGDGDYMRKKK